ncbi:3-keto-disaccharide hydrolase [Stutzerimonas stutzeri]|uniref:3-keto-disaccharide hydrolase n=1 Tax=Stutzerimonas stutzeri TaxID=316 RepID=UPI000F7B5642|nr:DUF1080 domain-containing protein [Stutzerimonas stutzeri]MBS9725469.1 DUF1080 domain-containing protein [Stutzerimonas stutzeri]MDH0499207.1 DUF1080 domain-containing protein [Stutzerimonas stutzeri]RRV60117.1 DUF1080 domain-containing protein [Stutzerimonas stutzeri]RRW04252.1 DUF1080 domain-containing protein [Stutzerimonas stutzeri]RTM24435.1 DUF1080 domain-containing protein [Stutzerimonas stutzeri]
MILDATQWRAWHGADFPEGSWYRDEEQLCAIVGAPRIDLISRERYANFILRFEYALPVGGNSGVFYRVDEAAELAWHSGPEMQLLDDAVHPDGAEPTTRNGALYGLLATQQETPIEPGSFMEGALLVRGMEVEHWLDNRMVLGYRLDDPALRTLIGASKFADKPLYAQAGAGHIVLQHHGEAVRFRRLSIEPLS